jgi:DNA-binding transcriptional LysR family regulator
VLLTRTGSPGLRDALERAIGRLGGEERIAQEVAEMQTVVGLVAAGVGISLVPESLHELTRRGVVYRPLEGDPPRARLAMAWREADSSPVLGAFVRMARAAVPAEEREGGGDQRGS